MPVHPDQLRGGASRSAGHKMPNEGLLANNREAAPSTGRSHLIQIDFLSYLGSVSP